MFFSLNRNKDDLQQHLQLVNKELDTPLLCAAIRGYAEVFEALFKNGADVNDVDHNGRNFIHIAVEGNHANFLKVSK